MKRTKKLIILLCALALAVGAYAAVTLLTKEEETVSETSVLLESSEVTEIKYKDVDLALSDGEWVCLTDENFPLDQSYPTAMASALCNLVSEYSVGTGDFAQYGLSDAANEIIFVADGITHTLLVGELNSINGCYYAVLDNSEDIYMLSSDTVSNFNYALYDMAVVDELPDMTDLSALTIEQNGSVLNLYAPEDPYEIYHSGAYTWFAVDENTVTPLDDTSVSSLTTYLMVLSFSGCADYAPKDLSVYGLDTPQMTVTAAYSDADGRMQTFTMKIGNLANEYYYTLISGSDMVYKLSADTYTAFKEASVKTLESTGLFDVYIEDTESVTYTLDGVTETIEITAGEENTYTAKGVTIGTAIFEDWFNAMDFTVDKVLEENTKAVNAPYITIKFNGTYGELTMEISEYDINFYLVSFGGRSRHLVNKNFIEEFANQTRALLAE